jgi:hypothetical protein
MAGCKCEAVKASGDPAGRSISALSGVRRGKKRSASKKKRTGKGKHCVYSPKGKLFTCFEKESSARKVVKGMSKRSPGWTLRTKR